MGDLVDFHCARDEHLQASADPYADIYITLDMDSNRAIYGAHTVDLYNGPEGDSDRALLIAALFLIERVKGEDVAMRVLSIIEPENQ